MFSYYRDAMAQNLSIRALLCALVLAAAAIFSVHGVETIDEQGHKRAPDIIAFTTPGDLVRMGGKLMQAYDLPTVHKLQSAYSGDPNLSYLWNYPPITTALFAYGLPPNKQAALALVCLATLMLTWLLYRPLPHRLGREEADTLLMAALPVLAFILLIGQPAGLFAGIVIFAAWRWQQSRDGAGIVLLAVATLKPHLALGLLVAIGLPLLLKRGGVWQLAKIGAAIMALHGTGFVFMAWHDAMPVTEVVKLYLAGFGFMHEHLPQMRHNLMLTGHGMMLSLGLSATVAAMAQFVMMAIGLAAIVAAPARLRIAVGLMVTPLFTPYFFFYDLLVVAGGLAMATMALAAERRLVFLRRAGFLVLLMSLLTWATRELDAQLAADAVMRVPNPGALLLLGLLGLTFTAMRPDPLTARAGSGTLAIT